MEARKLKSSDLKNPNLPIKIAIVGGGVSALATAYYIEKFIKSSGINAEICIFEQESQVGGKIRSERRGDFLVEFGPDSIATRQPAVMSLIRELGLESDVIAPKLRRFAIMRNGKILQVDLSLLAPFPKNIKGLFTTKLVSLSGKLRACLGGILSFLTKDKIYSSKQDQDLSSYFRSKWGDEMFYGLLDPLFSGLYGGDLAKISKTVLQSPNKSNRELRLPPYIGFRAGISSIIEAIKNSLKNTDFCFSEPIRALFKSEHGILVRSSKDSFEFNVCVLTTPAHVAERILQNSLPEASRILSEFQCSDAAIVSLGFIDYQAAEGLLDLAGSGVIIPESESSSVRGITISSRKWENRAPDNMLLVRVFGREGVFEKLSETDAISLAMIELGRIIKVKGELVYSECHKWKWGSALCGVGHQDRVANLRRSLVAMPGLFVTGAPYGGVGIGDCIDSAQKVAQQISEYLSSLEDLSRLKQSALGRQEGLSGTSLASA